MDRSAISYHVRLAQDILTATVGEPGMHNEIYCQLIRLTNKHPCVDYVPPCSYPKCSTCFESTAFHMTSFILLQSDVGHMVDSVPPMCTLSAVCVTVFACGVLACASGAPETQRPACVISRYMFGHCAFTCTYATQSSRVHLRVSTSDFWLCSAGLFSN